MTERAEYVQRLILARCSEIDLEDLAVAFGSSADADLPAEIGEQILAVCEAMEEKLDQLAQAIGDDDDDDRRGIGPAGEGDT